ncbi:hypothetical protein BT69DRAFT_1222449 [Atractiella rhizophila]|nr:hypothetical protein BT69DRAFT_1222449 [Atractiella rhizophila]
MRPFESVSELETRLRKTKGIPNSLVDNFRLINSSYRETDRLLETCEKEGEELSRIMAVWTRNSRHSEAGHKEDGLDLTEISNVCQGEGEFKGFLESQPKDLAEGFVLKNYQMLGLNWLNLLYSRRTSCILADEMGNTSLGLGKTAQVIALLTHLKAIKEPGPHLIIVPSSTLDNWLREFSRFSPSLNVHSYYGTQAERASQRSELKRATDLDVVVTTYNIATGHTDDRKFLGKKMGFQVCIYDEGHMLKNNESKKYKELMQIRVSWRLLLTGTPLQNNLQELVSLLSFIMPHIFDKDAAESLRAIFKVPPEAQVNFSRERITRAKKMMTPFVLRRKKFQVLKDLPQKLERIEYCELTDMQRQVYRETMLRSKKTLLGAADINKLAGEESSEEVKKNTKTTKTGRKTTNNSSANVLMELRKAANHPMLFRKLYSDAKVREISKSCLMEPDFMDSELEHIVEELELYTDYELHRICATRHSLQKYKLPNEPWMQGGKIDVLRQLIPELKEKGDRILLFSQFTSVLDILEAVLDTMQIRYLKLTGQTTVSDRQGLVDTFTEDKDITVFLLSTRAGGLGLNLMAANTVIIHDQDFNPHNDRQAEDRAFRLGQTRDVTVIRLISRGTIEEDIYKIAQSKLKLDESVSSASKDNQSLISGAGMTQTTGQVEKVENTVTLGEGDQALFEKRMKTSLLRNLQARFQEEAGAETGTKDDVVKSKYF